MHWLVAKFLAERRSNRNLAFLARTSAGDVLAYKLAKIAKGFIIDSMTFKYRCAITITEQSGSDLTDYQVLIELNSTNFDFSHAQTNGEDIRFTDASGNLLDYYIEEWGAVNEKAKVWVKVPSIPANGTVEIYCYYGNSEITSASDASATFIRVIDGLVASWHFDEGSGTTAHDTSGNDNDGTLGPGSGSVSNEKFTSNYDNWVQLKHTNIDEDSEIVTTLDGGVTYTRGIDYEMDYANGKIKVLSTGSMEDNTDYYIDYTYSNSYPLWVDGKFGKALSFDDVDDYVWIGKDLTNDDMTVALWLNVNSLSKQIVIQNGNGAGWGPGPEVVLKILNDLIFAVSVEKDASGNAVYTSLPTNTWTHVAGVLSSEGNMYLYKNGILVKSNTWPGHINKSSYDFNNFIISFDLSDRVLDGMVDELLIFNKALTSEEVSDLYSNYGYTTENYPGKVLVRKYTEPEPCVSVEAEETA